MTSRHGKKVSFVKYCRQDIEKSLVGAKVNDYFKFNLYSEKFDYECLLQVVRLGSRSSYGLKFATMWLFKNAPLP